ncbi:uncharacterized protein LOC143577272 [Bidens hawaiensis]|uniref:uncharacterized protein LOC143577272 n=1 Tax=Bidens hawaiensis TaxID=980011 RepID=UPI0040494919
MLKKNNYTTWALRIKVVFRSHDLWDVVEPRSVAAVDEKKNSAAIANLFLSIPEEQIQQVGQYETAWEIWNAIKTRYVGEERVKEARLHTLITEFETMRIKDPDTIDDFSGRLSGIASKFTSLSFALDEQRLVRKFFTSMPKRFINIVASLEQVIDLKAIKYEKAGGKKGKGKRHQEQSRDKSKGKYNWNKEGDSGMKRDYLGVQFFHCDEMGHLSLACPERRGKRVGAKQPESNLNEANGQATKEVLMKISINEEIFLNEENVHPKRYESKPKEDGIWYLDNGANNHMTGTKSYFSDLDETVAGQVRFGDSSCVDIKGKSSITTISDDGVERVITNIYYPKFNEQYFNLGTSNRKRVQGESGYKFGIFRTDNGGEFTSCEFSKFYTSEGITRHYSTPYTPQQNGVEERRNRTMIDIIRSMLHVTKVPKGFWGEAARNAIYILNRVPTKSLTQKTPYEAYKGVKPNLDHLRIFGCVGYVKTPPAISVKKLDDRSTPIVYLGT